MLLLLLICGGLALGAQTPSLNVTNPQTPPVLGGSISNEPQSFHPRAIQTPKLDPVNPQGVQSPQHPVEPQGVQTPSEGLANVRSILRREKEIVRNHKKSNPRKRFKKRGSTPLTRHFGVPDATAVVGVKFRMRIPRNAFRGAVGGYEVKGLPPWLEYVPKPPSIKGVPPPTAGGSVVYVRVTPLPPDHGDTPTPPAGETDTFAISISSGDQTPQPPRVRRSPDYPTYDEYEYDEYDPHGGAYPPDYAEYSGDHDIVTPAYTETASTVTVTRLPPPIQPTRVVVEASPTAPVQPTVTFKPVEPTQPTLVVEATRTLTPATTTAPPTAPPSTPPPVASSPAPPPAGDVTDHLVRNFPPEVTQRINKLAWVGGFLHTLPIPPATFQDLEDGDTRSLRLVLLNADRSPISPNSWVQLDPVRQVIYALPLEDQIGHYVYLLEAVDSGGKSVHESVKIHVQQPKRARNFLHKYTAVLRAAKTYEYEFAFALDWHVAAVHKIAALMGDNDTQNINVRSISENPTKISWTNVSLVDIQSTECPNAGIDYMNQVLFGVPEPAPQADPQRGAAQAFQPEFQLKRLHVHYSGPCEARHRVPQAEVPPQTPNSPPRFLNQVDHLNLTAGVPFRRSVPQDACYDMEEGNTRNLRLSLLTHDLRPPPPTAWLQFDPTHQQFWGLPLLGDVGVTEYTLECVDGGGAKANDALTVVVHPSPLVGKPAPHEGEIVPQPPASFSLTLDHDFARLSASPSLKMALVDKIGRAFGDADGGGVVVWSLEPGSVVVSWYNSSLGAPTICPTTTITHLHDVMLTPLGAVRPEFASHFPPEFEVVGGEMKPGGACLAPHTPQHSTPPDLGDDDYTHVNDFPPDDDGVRGSTADQKDVVLTFLIPSLLMAAMLVVAAVAACCLYRHRRRYAKLSLAGGGAPDTSPFVTTTGIPVILAEELDDPLHGSRSPAAKTPVIMREEKPPLPPYPQHPQQYQQPPPPTFSNGGASERGGNSLPPPAYRKPAYVPP